MLRGSSALLMVAWFATSGALGCSTDTTIEPSADTGLLDAAVDSRAEASTDATTDSNSDASDALETSPPDDALDASEVGDVSTDALSEVGEAGDAALDGDAARVCLPAIARSELGGTCAPVIENWPDEGATHVPSTEPVAYCTKPPSSGNHFSDWASYKTYDKPVPHGNLVHSLEHGAVILWYRCPTAMLPCKTTQDALVKIANAQPVDPMCIAPTVRRVIVVPEPTLDVAIAASAWQWTYRATCVDDKSLGDFITAHYAKSAENLCADGIDPTAP